MGNFAFGQTMLPEWSIIIGQKMVKNAKIQQFECDIFGNFSRYFWGFLSSDLLVHPVFPSLDTSKPNNPKVEASANFS